MKYKTLTLSGKSASFGLTKGTLYFYHKEESSLDSSTGHNPKEEEEKLSFAIAAVKKDLIQEEAQALDKFGKEEAALFGVHRMMLDDMDFLAAMQHCLSEGHTAAYAARMGAKQLAARLANTGDAYMMARASDLDDIGERLAYTLLGKERRVLPSDAEGLILCAKDLTPGETATLDKSKVRAFLLSEGSVGAHSAILARSMGIPAIVGLKEALFSLPEGEEAFVDADAGRVTLFPSEEEKALFFEKVKAKEKEKSLREIARGKRFVSKSGHTLAIYGNIGSEEQAAAVKANDGEGVGLFRSEFLFLGRKCAPDEEEQYRVYRAVLEKMEGRRVVIRTLDIGADKKVPYLMLAKEENPALGLRGIRLCFAQEVLFRTQLRALLRASLYGKLAILFPMITSVNEVKKAKRILQEEESFLLQEGIEACKTIEIGVMIETPAAAILSEELANEVDFFSVGTNDLAQYTLALDRENEAVLPYADQSLDAVMRLIALTAEHAHKAGIWIGICGELAADRQKTKAFLEMGIDELSVAPSEILSLRAHLFSLGE